MRQTPDVSSSSLQQHASSSAMALPSSPVGTPVATRRAVVVHAGARDAYQLAAALAETDLLESLVTDLYWPSDSRVGRLLERLSPALARQLLQRSSAGLPSRRVRRSVFRGFMTLLAERLRKLPQSLRRRAHRNADAALGRRAGRFAKRTGSGLVSYSYYGFDAMRAYGQPAMLFQVHPHPVTVRRLLQEELGAHPDCAESLTQEWELALPEDDFAHLVQEPRMAKRFLVASSFTKQSLVENGADPAAISVVPYGVDLERFRPPSVPFQPSRTLRLLFVGRINQRKGVKYLLEALKQFAPKDVHLTICGRVVDSLSLIKSSGLDIELRPFVSAEELVQAYQHADLFVFPSVAEGFAQVLLESLACGLPILSTTHTAAPDLITEGREGFIIPPRRPDLLADRIQWCLDHRETLLAMRQPARATAEHFTWARFRADAASAVRQYLETCP